MAATNKKKPYSLTPPHPQVVSIQPAPTGRALESESVYPTNGSNMGINMGINKKRPERRLFVDKLAERVGFEPTVRENRTPDFESGTFDHSATSPLEVAILALTMPSSGIGGASFGGPRLIRIERFVIFIH